MSSQRAAAFVPGHITAFFSAHPADRPAHAGSRGAGLTLTDGVTTRVSATNASDGGVSPPTRTVDGTRVTIDAIDVVLAELGLDPAAVSVAVDTEVPIGAGFGVSGAAALGTAIAANDAFNCGRSENDLIRIAHVAEVRCGTGLGDVVAQARGGVPIRLAPGAPGIGTLDGIPTRTRVEYVPFGELSTETVLDGDTDTLSAAGEAALDTVRADPRLSTLMTAARSFARNADLLVPKVDEAITAVADVQTDSDDGAAMAMLGRTVFALETGLSDAGYEPAVCQTHPGGAQLVESTTGPDSQPP